MSGALGAGVYFAESEEESEGIFENTRMLIIALG